ncbi:DEAD/DEAH box helicase [Candidatus Liberibacter africanus]|uniref:DEAD/DEAH box helicase n=1 Tax=Liberibacter africanus TaxID=34020 RepID=UPI001AE16A19|nr:DEAD/DEAH box helicase [Candidatus Liberibacter africanus]QTP63901.1 DEAD/DEAH box helicase [Candidatus Liberibacter africanus]
MLLRERQKELVDKAIDALNTHGNTLAVAPTGAGKTIMFSAVLGHMFQRGLVNKACVIAHRDELTDQNEAKFKMVNPNITTSRFNASVKNWNGQVCFAMVQTLNNHFMSMPKIELLVIDEAHHATAKSYQTILNQVRTTNPHCKILGMTATPNRGDGEGLKTAFSNVADQITMSELIASGHLVKPCFFVIDLGIKEELSKIQQKGSDYDMDQVSHIMNTAPINSEIIRHWREKAGDRQTVVFCSTIEHASDVTETFTASGVKAKMVWGNMGDEERFNVLKDFEQGNIQVLVNVAVLTEGWDCPPVSCVVLLRPSSYKSTVLQMIGRGLRIVDPEIYPNIVKKDCIVMDFGISLIKHGFLEQKVNLKGRKKGTRKEEEEGILIQEAKKDPIVIADFQMKEWDGFKGSPFEWYNVLGKGGIFVATGFDAWGCITHKKGIWFSFGGSKEDKKIRLLMKGAKVNCLARANDWINIKELTDKAYKNNRWINQPATVNQLNLLHPSLAKDYSLTKYQASALITLRAKLPEIKKTIEGAK